MSIVAPPVKKLLFVCLGNICRSPAAEGIMQTLVRQAGLEPWIHCDSAGTSAYHEGEPADARMIYFAKERGFELNSLSRPFRAPSDFLDFNWILTMDRSNFLNVTALDSLGKHHHKVQPMVRYCRQHNVQEVPDPYYDSEKGFHLVLDILEDACQGLLEAIRPEVNHG